MKIKIIYLLFSFFIVACNSSDDFNSPIEPPITIVKEFVAEFSEYNYTFINSSNGRDTLKYTFNLGYHFKGTGGLITRGSLSQTPISTGLGASVSYTTRVFNYPNISDTIQMKGGRISTSALDGETIVEFNLEGFFCEKMIQNDSDTLVLQKFYYTWKDTINIQ